MHYQSLKKLCVPLSSESKTVLRFLLRNFDKNHKSKKKIHLSLNSLHSSVPVVKSEFLFGFCFFFNFFKHI